MKALYGRQKGTRKQNLTVGFDKQGWVHLHTWSALKTCKDQHMRLVLNDAQLLYKTLGSFLFDYDEQQRRKRD